MASSTLAPPPAAVTRRVTGPSFTGRQETWGLTLTDGWTAERRDEPGTPWHLTHPSRPGEYLICLSEKHVRLMAGQDGFDALAAARRNAATVRCGFHSPITKSTCSHVGTRSDCPIHGGAA